MKKLFLAILVAGCMSFSATHTSNLKFLVDPTVVVTATIGLTANALPDHIVTDESGLIFALCVNYLMIEDKGSYVNRIAKFAASYIAGAVVGRIIKAGTKRKKEKPQPASPKITQDVDEWLAQ